MINFPSNTPIREIDHFASLTISVDCRAPLEMWLVALTEKPFCRIPFRRVTMRADADSLDLDAVFFLSAETVDSL